MTRWQVKLGEIKSCSHDTAIITGILAASFIECVLSDCTLPPGAIKAGFSTALYCFTFALMHLLLTASVKLSGQRSQVFDCHDRFNTLWTLSEKMNPSNIFSHVMYWWWWWTAMSNTSVQIHPVWYWHRLWLTSYSDPPCSMGGGIIILNCSIITVAHWDQLKCVKCALYWLCIESGVSMYIRVCVC